MSRIDVAALVLAALLACDRKGAGRAHDGGGAAAGADAAPIARRAQPRRLVAIGDLHGDLAATRAALRLAGAIGPAGDGGGDAGVESDHWIGGTLVVVQTGDVLDRGDGERAMLELLERLEGEAAAAGGAVVVLDGNHELMNVMGDFRYVTEGGFEDFGGRQGRAAAFAPGGPWAQRLARHDVVAVVGDTLFVHGGVLPEHVEYGLARMNDEVHAWLAGKGPEPRELTRDAESPVWSRSWGDAAPDCGLLAKTLAAVPAKRMVVGHTTMKGGISEACDGALWRIDVGLASVYGGPLEVLEIRADGDGGAVTVAAVRGSR